MSLVDYASSSEDDEDVPKNSIKEERQNEGEEGEGTEENPQSEPSSQLPKREHPPPTVASYTQRSGTLANKQQESASQSSAPSTQKLPDASFLLNSPATSLAIGTDHASRVAAAMVESASRKRDLSGLPSSLPRSKVPKGTLPHTKNIPDTVGGVLLPPQLKGRSNVVTEDIGKLFVKRHAEPSSH